MTIKELILELQKFPQDHQVLLPAPGLDCFHRLSGAVEPCRIDEFDQCTHYVGSIIYEQEWWYDNPPENPNSTPWPGSDAVIIWPGH